jgi:hypothetical protein
MKKIKPVFPYFGGKARVADLVWSALGECDGFLDPFGGGLGVPLGNPFWRSLKSETINDLNGYVANFWRAVKAHPEQVASFADNPVNQVEIAARHRWLVDQRSDLVDRLSADIDYCDPEIAGWWVWGICTWIGSGWCDGSLHKKRPHSGDHGMGIHALGQRPHLANHGRGIHALGQRPHLGDHGMGGYYDTFAEIAQRLRHTRVTCCKWESLKSTIHRSCGRWGVFLDPPYTAESGRDASLYNEAGDGSDHLSIGHDVAKWAFDLAASRPDVAVVLCGIEGEYEIPDGWRTVEWKTSGYSYGGRNRKECLWLSPSCHVQK